MDNDYTLHKLVKDSGYAGIDLTVNKKIKIALWYVKKIVLLFLLLMLSGGLFYVYHVYIMHSFDEVVPGQVYRSAQPTPERLGKMIKKYNLKTIVNLRGPTSPEAKKEEDVAEQMGVKMIYIEVSANYPIPAVMLNKLIDTIRNADRPILFHCNEGIDRSGVASALAVWFLGGKTYEQAKWQAFILPGPWKNKKGHGHISSFFNLYEQYCRKETLDPDNKEQFINWAQTIYDVGFILKEPSNIPEPNSISIVLAQKEIACGI